MPTLTISDIDPNVAQALQDSASEHGRSLEAEARQILSDAVGHRSTERVGLGEAIRRRFAPLGGADDLVLPPREPVGDPPTFDP